MQKLTAASKVLSKQAAVENYLVDHERSEQLWGTIDSMPDTPNKARAAIALLDYRAKIWNFKELGEQLRNAQIRAKEQLAFAEQMGLNLDQKAIERCGLTPTGEDDG